MKKAKFDIGQIVHHRRFDYRGVIYDVDAIYSGTEDWYKRMTKSNPPKDQPWYHVLVDQAQHHTYVAEQNLEPGESSSKPVKHPLINHYFNRFVDGHYDSNHSNN